MEYKISPTLLNADLFQLPQIIKQFEKDKIDSIHIDVMDGEFVPNLSFGASFCNQLRKATNIPLDIHLMMVKPDNKISWFDVQKGETLAVHYEATPHIQRVLANIKDLGAKSSVVLNPATPICVLENILDVVDTVLIMTVNPGYGGQKFIPACMKKISDTRKMLNDRGYGNINIEVDGNVGFDNIKELKKHGANIFVGGTASIFFKGHSLEENIRLTKEAIES